MHVIICMYVWVCPCVHRYFDAMLGGWATGRTERDERGRHDMVISHKACILEEQLLGKLVARVNQGVKEGCLVSR